MAANGGSDVRIGLLFLLSSLASIWLAWRSGSWALAVIGGHVTAALALLGAAYVTSRPSLLGKQAEGQRHLAVTILILPNLALQALLYRMLRPIAFPPAQISDRVLLGPRLTASDAALLDQHRVTAILDLTAEFAEPVSLIRARAYKCLPVLDGEAPTPKDLSEAMGWISAQQGAIYVHCALGHGRSASIVAAWLVHSGECASLDEALRRLKSLRNRAGLNPAHMTSVKAFLNAETVQRR
ncbi:hypothetical protein C7S18_15715 [Ahniella affigens]|uniref:Uncharacterized protein n=1 Tax=Ahniella affigens TaxID=2021234 RepID=A0A2P1PUM8_9GAMM|nr:dual specificity protein phosphatase family protein [Ahniella affigens]AVP98544.1 hypothetical protein C7S18_15715 [Ahniella affigens]